MASYITDFTIICHSRLDPRVITGETKGLSFANFYPNFEASRLIMTYLTDLSLICPFFGCLVAYNEKYDGKTGKWGPLYFDTLQTLDTAYMQKTLYSL